MKIYMMTDLEGPAGVNLWAQTREGETPAKRAAMHLLTMEVNAAVEGILDAEPQAEVIVRDGHGSGGLIYEEMHPAAQVIMRCVNSEKVGLIEEADGADALMFVGQHAMANTPGGPLCHTYSSKNVDYYKLNGEFVGETGSRAAQFGEYDIPTIFLAGDDKACEEVVQIIPEIVTVSTKKGLGVQMAAHLSAVEARKRIRAGAAEAVKKIGGIPPYKIAPPYELETRVLPGVNIENIMKQPCDKAYVKDERTVVRCAQRLNDLF